jgi:hypothetical protein
MVGVILISDLKAEEAIAQGDNPAAWRLLTLLT